MSAAKKKNGKKKKIEKVMREFKRGALRSGSSKGPRVTSRNQAIAIALSESKRLGKKTHKSRAKKRK